MHSEAGHRCEPRGTQPEPEPGQSASTYVMAITNCHSVSCEPAPPFDTSRSWNRSSARVAAASARPSRRPTCLRETRAGMEQCLCGVLITVPQLPPSTSSSPMRRRSSESPTPRTAGHRAHWPLPRRSHRTDGLERRRTGSTTHSTLHRLPTLRAGNARRKGRVQMIQSGVTRAVRAWAGEASSRLSAKSRAQKLRRLSRAPIEAIEGY